MIPIENIPHKSNLIDILWTPQDFIDITQDIIYPKLFTSAVLLADYEIIGIVTNPTYRGTTVETLINLLLEKGAKFIFHTVEDVRELK